MSRPDMESTEPMQAIYARLLGRDLVVNRSKPGTREGNEAFEAEITQLLDARAYEQAMEKLEAAAASDPDNAWIQHRMGIVNRVAGNFVVALAHYTAALRLDADFPTGVAHYCYTLHQMGETMRAVNILNFHLAINPQDKDAAKIQRMIATRHGGTRG